MTDSPSQTRLLADVLWEAANERLAPPNGYSNGTSAFSCNAALCAEMPRAYERASELKPLRKKSATNAFLAALGCQVNSMYAFCDEYTDSRQGVRYMWLLLAACVAEDEGIEVTL